GTESGEVERGRGKPALVPRPRWRGGWRSGGAERRCWLRRRRRRSDRWGRRRWIVGVIPIELLVLENYSIDRGTGPVLATPADISGAATDISHKDQDSGRLPSSHLHRQSESWATHGSDKEKEDEEVVQAKNEEVDSFIAAAEKTGPPQQNIDCTAAARRQANNYAKVALEHYNKDENNKIQYRFIKALKSCAIQTNESYGHVNFVASSSDSKEEFFFAEVCYDPKSNGLVPTCMVSLEENNRIGGLLGVGFVGCPDLLNPPVDNDHCYACDDRLKHPKDGTLFKGGHVAATGFYASY
ncbi:hypothetical protein EE612_030968, partial [Oryza sativa]